MDLVLGKSNESSLSGIIKTIDSASDEARTSAISASKEVEEAKRNARAASEVARRYMNLASLSGLSVDTSRSLLLDSLDLRHGSPRGTPQKLQRYPPSPLSNLNRRSPERPRNGRLGSPVSNNSGPTSDRLARANADAVVSLTLELDRCKRHLEAEQMTHDETKALLSQTKSRNVQLEAHIEKLLNDMETQRDEYGRKIGSLEHDVSRAQLQVTAAEEDAQLALDLAKQNNDSRLEVEACLEQTLQQSERLQMELQSKTLMLQSLSASPPLAPVVPVQQSTPINGSQDPHPHLKSSVKSVRFVDSPSTNAAVAGDTTPVKTGGRADIMAGRQLLQRALNGGATSTASDDDMSADIYCGYQASVERSHRLQETLRKNSLEIEIMTPSSVASSVTATPQTDGKDAQKQQVNPASSVLQAVTSILKGSGRRLYLSGRWWNDKGTSSRTSERDAETLARHYCTSVEILLEQKHKEIVELESLCALWEKSSDGNAS